MTVELLTEHCLEFLSLTGGCTGSSESTLVKMSNCWKSRAAAHFICPSSDNASQPGGLIKFILSEQYKQLFFFDGIFNVFRENMHVQYVIVIPWVVRLYVEIIHEL